MMIRVAPGDPASAKLGPGAEKAAIEVLRKQLHLGGNPFTQFFSYLNELIHGNLGVSLQAGVKVIDIINRTLPLTIYLILLSTLCALIVSIPIGTFIGWSGKGPLVYGFRGLTAIFLATPNFFIAMVGILFFSVRHNWAPVFGYDNAFPQNLHYIWLPVAVNTLIMSSVISRVLFSSVSETKDEEFVET